ncbi:MAG: bifunctional aldolase/short-chain dehydrogenase [Deltaproteobacteria bacterium]|nr:bifunctional aldolase/short-chain dehydrogenase [Deltaproteobacteria bacterium]
MESRWQDSQADEYVKKYAQQGVPEELALRVYTSRLIGADDSLVLHGGGNTSVKGRARDPLGAEVDVLYVKGSGWDLATIEPQGFPAVRLEPLLGLRQVAGMSDEEMVNVLRTNLLDASAPNPSVEALLHAFLPHRFVDHTHADAILALVDQPDPEARCREAFGDRLAVLEFVFPGFPLAGRTMEAFERNPEVEGIVLLKHGLFTFGDTARESYERMIRHVARAAEALQAGGRDTSPKKVFARASGPALHEPGPDELACVAQVLRGALATRNNNAAGGWNRMVLHHRTSEAIRGFVDGGQLADYSRRGVVTPDHIIRTKNLPLLLPPLPDSLDGPALEKFAAGVREGVAGYARDYESYFQAGVKHSQAKGSRVEYRMLDPLPRVLLLPGAGVFTAARDEKSARIAGDLYEHTVSIIAGAEALGKYTPLEPVELFEMEYWSLEQAKLGKSSPPPLAGHVVLVTGAASGIGKATARAFAARGAHLALLDMNGELLEQTAAELRAAKGLNNSVLALACDVTSRADVARAFRDVSLRFGGVDIVVSNAGRVWQGTMADVDEAALRESFELNFFAHQHLAAEAVRVFRRQGTGGQLLFNASKSAFNPGPDMGPYTLAKAAVVALMKQYAVEQGGAGVRSNAINADRIPTALFGEGVLEQRAAKRGVSVEEYLSGNLLGRMVRAEDVAEAFVMLALSERTTGTVLPVDGGNIAAAPR